MCFQLACFRGSLKCNGCQNTTSSTRLDVRMSFLGNFFFFHHENFSDDGSKTGSLVGVPDLTADAKEGTGGNSNVASGNISLSVPNLTSGSVPGGSDGEDVGKSPERGSATNISSGMAWDSAMGNATGSTAANPATKSSTRMFSFSPKFFWYK